MMIRNSQAGTRGIWSKLSRLAMLPVALGGLVAGAASASAQSHQIVVTIHEVRALDNFDALSRGDIFARATIAGEINSTPVFKQAIKQGETIRPAWTLSRTVKPGVHAIKLELFDKDVTKDEVIDINRLPNKRIQEFTINTRNCRISGFAGAPRCGMRITRAGTERKSADIIFSVDVKK